MRYSEIKNKVLINIRTGEKIGMLKNCDLIINEKSGKIESIAIPAGKTRSIFFSTEEMTLISWNKIINFGVDTIIVSI